MNREIENQEKVNKIKKVGKNEKRSKGLLGLIYRFSRLTVVFSFGIDNRGNHGK